MHFNRLNDGSQTTAAEEMDVDTFNVAYGVRSKPGSTLHQMLTAWNDHLYETILMIVSMNMIDCAFVNNSVSRKQGRMMSDFTKTALRSPPPPSS